MGLFGKRDIVSRKDFNQAVEIANGYLEDKDKLEVEVAELTNENNQLVHTLQEVGQERDNAEKKAEELTIENKKLQDKLNSIAQIQLEQYG